jgi:hypothetical protein
MIKKIVLIIIKLSVKYIPITKNIWLCLYFSGVISDKAYPFIGHSIEYDLLLLLLSILFGFCYWHYLLIFSLMFCVFFEFLQNSGMLLGVKFFNVSIFIILNLIGAAILYHKYGCFIKKKTI